MFTTVLIATTAVLFFTWLIFYFKQNQNLPPGPVGLPIVGYYPFLSSRPYLEFTELSKRYGKIFSFTTVGGNLIVVLNGVDMIKNVLINRAEEFTGRPKLHNPGMWLSDGLGIAQQEGPVWKEHRRFFLHTSKALGLGKQESEALIHEEVKTLVNDLMKEDGKSANFKFHVAYAVNSVVFQILFSKKFEKCSSLFNEIFMNATEMVQIFADQRIMLLGPFFKHFVQKYFPSMRNVRRAKTLFDRFCKELVEDHIKTFDPENLRDYIDSFLEHKYKLDKTDSDHSFTKETTIEGYRIPRRTTLLVNQWSINNDPLLHPEPQKFDPKRYLDGNGKKIKTVGPYAFGIGKRSCTVESLIEMEVFIITASILQKFTLYPADESGYIKAVPRERSIQENSH